MSFGLPPEEETLSYGGYLRVPQLLALQELRSDPPRHDETLFIVIHQVYELWFKQLLHEIDAVVRRMDADDVLGAGRLMRRCIEIQRVLVAQIKVLETMTPVDFLSFRDHLRPASGFQSAQFREIEFASGLKEPKMVERCGADDEARARLEARLAAPSLEDAFHALLRRRGFRVPTTPADADPARREAEHDARVDELVRLYRESERHADLFLLAEALIEYDEMFLLWRVRHVQMVERVIGGAPGTGGSSGAGYLRSTTGRRFFPELWEIRTRLSAAGPAPASDGDAGTRGCPVAH